MPVVQRQLGRAVYKPSLRLIHFSRNSVLFLRIASNSRNCERRIKHQDHSRGCREGSRWKPYSAIVKEIVLRTVTYLRSIAKMPSEYTAWVCSRGGGGEGRSCERDWVIIGKLELNIWGIQPRSQWSSAKSNVTSLVTLVGRICVRFQASSARSDCRNLPGDEAGRDQDWH